MTILALSNQAHNNNKTLSCSHSGVSLDNRVQFCTPGLWTKLFESFVLSFNKKKLYVHKVKGCKLFYYQSFPTGM